MFLRSDLDAGRQRSRLRLDHSLRASAHSPELYAFGDGVQLSVSRRWRRTGRYHAREDFRVTFAAAQTDAEAPIRLARDVRMGAAVA